MRSNIVFTNLPDMIGNKQYIHSTKSELRYANENVDNYPVKRFDQNY